MVTITGCETRDVRFPVSSLSLHAYADETDGDADIIGQDGL